MRLAPRQTRFCVAGNGNQMNVIAHQAPSEAAQIVPLEMLAKDLQIALAVFVGEECDLPVVAALRDVMRRIGNDKAGLRAIVTLVG